MTAPLSRRYRLKGLRLDELSLVDAPANKAARVSIVKRDAEAPPADFDKELAEVRERVRALQTLVDNLPTPTASSDDPHATTQEQETMKSWENPEAIAKAVDEGNEQAFTLSDIIGALTKLAEQHQADDESLEQTFARIVREDPVAKRLYNARKDVRADPEPVDETPAPVEKSDAELELEERAKRYATAERVTYEQAFAEVTKSGRGAELMEQMRTGA